MDALAGYGSDSSSSGCNDDANDVKETSTHNNKNNKLSGLLGDDSDDSSSAASDQPGPDETAAKTTTNNSPKRSRSELEAPSSSSLLPEPPLSESSMIYWSQDYSAPYRLATSPSSTATASMELTKKLKSLQESSSMSWASHLKAQHEFHNPSFFSNVVTHFGIQQPLAAHAKEEVFQPFEFNLMAAEEQARIRQQQQEASSMAATSSSSASHLLAQQQLEQALQSRGRER